MAQPFLSNLGVTPIQQARTPTVDAFPLAFNTNARGEWGAAVQNLQTTGDTIKDWGLTIKEFVKLCTGRGVYPFQNVQQNRNDRITDYLRERRRQFVHFIDRSKFFEGVRVRTSNREVKATDTGFILRVTATAYIKDPSFVQWLTQMPMPNFSFIKHEGRHTKVLGPGLIMFAENERQSRSPERWIIGYEITCPVFPDIPTSHTPSRAEIEAFVLDVLWMPILRSARPQKLLHRLV